MENIKLHKSDELVSGIFGSSLSKVLKKMSPKCFFKSEYHDTKCGSDL